MNKAVKIILIIILVLVLVAAVLFAVKLGTSDNDNSGYTDDDLQGAYDRGYSDAGTDKDKLNEIIAKNTELVSQVENLTNTNNDLSTEIANLTKENDALIAQRDNLQSSYNDSQAEIDELNVQIANNRIKIDELQHQIYQNQTTVDSYASELAKMQSSISFLERFCAQFNNEDQALVTFEFDGVVYDGKVVNKGDRVTTTPPASTEYKIFNGWRVDGELIDLSTYVVNENVRIVADITYKYIVKFNVGNVTRYTQVVEKGQFAEKPTTPKQNGYTFKYWTLDGVNEIDVEQCAITQNTTFYAKYNELYRVTFTVGDEIVADRKIENGKTTSPPSITVPDGQEFIGWLLNGTTVDVAHYTITSDCAFVADIRGYVTAWFEYRIIENNSNGIPVWKWKYPTSQTVLAGNSPSFVSLSLPSSYTFGGWTIDGTNVIDLTKYSMTENTTFKGLITSTNRNLTYTVKFMSRDGKKVLSTQQVKWGEKPSDSFVTTSDRTITSNGLAYRLSGWTLNATAIGTGSGTYASDIAVNQDLTLYPVYTAMIYA